MNNGSRAHANPHKRHTKQNAFSPSMYLIPEKKRSPVHHPYQIMYHAYGSKQDVPLSARISSRWKNAPHLQKMPSHMHAFHFITGK